MKPLPCILALAALTALSSGCLAKSKDAQGDGYYWPPLSVSAGGQIFAGVDTKMRLDSDNHGIGTEIDLEDDFDVDDDVFAGRIDANWRFATRHALDLSVFDLPRNGTRAIDRDIQIGDEVFPVGTAVESEFETRVARLAYQWSFWRRERWNAGLSFGIHWFDLRTGWEAGAIGVEQDFDAKAPLPVLGAFWSHAFTQRLYLTAVSEFFGLEFEEYEGFLNDTRVVLEHRTFEHVAFGLGFDYFGMNASVESETEGVLEAEFDYDYFGLLFFARLY
jgi:hypothetical protein